jgi:hypothetical protein
MLLNHFVDALSHSECMNHHESNYNTTSSLDPRKKIMTWNPSIAIPKSSLNHIESLENCWDFRPRRSSTRPDGFDRLGICQASPPGPTG